MLLKRWPVGGGTKASGLWLTPAKAGETNYELPRVGRALLFKNKRAMKKLRQLPNVLVPVSAIGATLLSSRVGDALAVQWRND